MAKKILTPIDLSAVPSGTAPLVVTSPTAVTNLNADLLDGQHGSYYQNASNINAGTLVVARGGTGIASYTANNYIRALSSTVLEQRTPAQVVADIGAVTLNDTIMNNNAFGGRRLYIANIDNALAAADKRYVVTITTHLQTYLAESYPKLNPDWVASYSVSGAGTSFTVTGSPTAIVVYNGTTLCTVSGSPSTQFQYSYSGGVLTFGATVTGTITVYPDHTVPQYLDSPVESTLSSAAPFDGTYESMVTAPIGSYLKIRIMSTADGNTNFPGYPYGSFFLSHYYTSTGAGTSQYRCYNRNLHAHTIGWKVASFTDFVGTTASSAYIQTVSDELNHGRTILEFIVHSHPSRAASITEVEWKLTRPAMGQLPVITNYGANKLYHNLTLGAATTTSVTINPTGLIDLHGLAGEPRFRVANTALPLGVDFVLSSSGTVYGIFDRNGSAAWAVQFAASTRAATFNNTVTATGFTGPLTGNASTATALQTARTIAISGPITGTATSFNGTANITIPVTSLNLADAAVTGTLGAARMPALTGDVTTTVGTVATTIAAGAVTLAKMANMATASFLGRSTAGTGAPEVLSAATARTVMGATTAGGNFFTLANPGAITFPRINADNTVSALDAAAFRAAIGVTAGGGTVTSVNLGASTGLTPSGGPITGSGTLTYTLSANLQSWSGIAPAAKADDSGVVHKAGTETITGTKTFSQPIRLAIGGVGTQQIMTHWGWNNGVARWKWAMEGNAGLSLYSYDTTEGNPTQSLFISTTQTGGANALTASLPFKATSLAAGTNAQIGAFPFDVDSSVGRVLIRNNGGTNSLDSVNHANNAYIQFNFHASGFVFNGGAMSISNGGLVTGGGITASTGDIIAGSGDLRSNRAGNPTHGVVWLGNTSSRYLFYDGTNYTMPGAQLYVNGGLVYHSGNYNPANAANFTTGTLLSGVMPTGMGSAGTTITDWNNATSNGIYMASAAANAPSSAWFIGRVTVHNSGWITQEVWDFTGNAGTNVWRRGLFNGTWSGWTQNMYIAGVLLSTDGSNTLVTQGTPRSWNRPQILYSNGAGYVETPRIFVQSSDPGAAAADGDLWFW